MYIFLRILESWADSLFLMSLRCRLSWRSSSEVKVLCCLTFSSYSSRPLLVNERSSSRDSSDGVFMYIDSGRGPDRVKDESSRSSERSESLSEKSLYDFLFFFGL